MFRDRYNPQTRSPRSSLTPSALRAHLVRSCRWSTETFWLRLLLSLKTQPTHKGVVNGNYRCSYLGFDLNRHWLDPTAWAQPEILSVKTLVTELHEDPCVDLDFFVGELSEAASTRFRGIWLMVERCTRTNFAALFISASGPCIL